MNIERTNAQNPIYDSERAISVGTISIDPGSGWGKRLDLDDEWFHLAPRQLTLLRILDRDNWINAGNIALQYELAEKLDKVTSAAIGRRAPYKQIDKTLKEIDEDYGNNPRALETSQWLVYVLIYKLRKKIGSQAIELKHGFGFRLTTLPENSSSNG
ncbi:hypothetical protein MUP56_00720 [Patescibacteria group bacterium]|nr:hypothetical protein [Patescibacteria group bacterium]